MGNWKDFCEDLNLQIVALLYSDYEGKCDRIDAERPILKGSVHHLERGEDVSSRPTIQAIAALLVDLWQAGQEQGRDGVRDRIDVERPILRGSVHRY